MKKRWLNVAEQEYQDKKFYFTDAVSDQAARYIKEAATDKPLFLYVAYTAAHWPLHARPENIEAYKGQYAMGWDQKTGKDSGALEAVDCFPRSTSQGWKLIVSTAIAVC
jgi:arylsulfatase A-like enzyme